MAVTDSFAGEITTISAELVKQLVTISAKPWRYKNTAEQLITLIESIQPTLKEIHYGGVELPAHRQAQIVMFLEKLEKGKKLTDKVSSSRQWNLYRQLTLAKKMEKLEKIISGFIAELFTGNPADIHRLQADSNVLRSSSSSSSSSLADSDSTYSLITPSLEFPDRISFRKTDLIEPGPSGTVADREYTDSTCSKSIEIRNFCNRKKMVLITSWLNGQFLGRGSLGYVYEGISVLWLMHFDGVLCQSLYQILEFTWEEKNNMAIGYNELKKIRCKSEFSLMTLAGTCLWMYVECRDGDFFAVNEVSHLDQGCQSQEEIALLSQRQLHHIISSSSSSVDSDSTCSFMTPSLEFPDRISFRKMDLSEAGPSGVVVTSNASQIYASGGSIITSSWQKGILLGQGSFLVYEGIPEDGDFFAVKEVSLLDQGSQAQERIQQLEGEIAILSQLQHQNIVQYHGTAKDGSNLYIFLELVTQGPLLKLYQRYKLQDSVVSLYARQILDGLKYLHEKGFIHRNIKCANILVDANGAVKLADFGLAKVSKFNDIMCRKGSPFWMAPEVINPKRNEGYGIQADIWSLGCTVLEMLTGDIPYSDLEPVKALFRIGRGMLPEIPDTLSQDARHFILKCLKVNPDERPTAADLLNHPFVRRPFPSQQNNL